MNEQPWFPDAPHRKTAEAELHKAIWQHILLYGAKDVIAFHPANGEVRSKRTGARLKAMGVVPGVPDLCFTLADGHSAYMEIKAPGGRLSPEQKAFQRKCELMGVEYACVFGIDAALAVLRAWNVLPNQWGK